MMRRRSVQFWAVTGSEECRLRRTKFGNTVSFLNVTPVISCFCLPPANILLSASLWVGTRSSGRQIFPLRRWRWTDCWLLPVRHWTCYSLLRQGKPSLYGNTHDFGAKKKKKPLIKWWQSNKTIQPPHSQIFHLYIFTLVQCCIYGFNSFQIRCSKSLKTGFSWN